MCVEHMGRGGRRSRRYAYRKLSGAKNERILFSISVLFVFIFLIDLSLDRYPYVHSSTLLCIVVSFNFNFCHIFKPGYHHFSLSHHFSKLSYMSHGFTMASCTFHPLDKTALGCINFGSTNKQRELGMV